MTAYFKNIWQTAATIFEGMAITLSYLLQRPVTVQYPDRMAKSVPETLPANYRGRLGLDVETCTACGLCAKACPIDVIDMKGARTERKKGLTLIYFNIYHGKCMYCNLCVEACPAEDEDHQTALFFKKEFEGSGYHLSDLVETFVSPEETKQLVREAAEVEAKRAAKRAEEAAAAEKASENPAPKPAENTDSKKEEQGS